MGVTSYRELIVWQKAIELAKAVYSFSQGLPREEVYGLASQLRRAAISVPSNIAEGQARRTTGEFVHFLSMAEGSLAEIDTQLVLAVELGFASQERAAPASALVSECQRMLRALRTKVITSP